MKKATVDVLVAQFCYGGNGGVPMTIPSHVTWLAKVYEAMTKDERIGRVSFQTLSDTPISMMRNRAVRTAIDQGYDMILMLDSDNQPDCEIKDDPQAKPFWSTSFDFVYNSLIKGVPTLVCAPYCGPPPIENVFVFYWENYSDSPHAHYAIQPYSRETASKMVGIQPIAAGPTGVTLYATELFSVMDPPYFYYEYKDKYQTEKASTEDVTNFRDLAMLGWTKYHKEVVYCNWDSWAAHVKIKHVRKPQMLSIEDVGERYREAVMRNDSRKDKIIDVGQIASNVAPLDPPDDPTTEPVSPTESNDSNAEDGIRITKRPIFGYVVTSLGHQTPMCDLEALADMILMSQQDAERRAIRAIDVGTWVGESAIAMARNFTIPGSVVYCVDDFSGGHMETPLTRVVDYLGGSHEVEEVFRRNCGEMLNKSIKLIKGESTEIARRLDPQEADLVFLDVCHTYEQAMEAISVWMPHVADTGILCGHDYDLIGYPGVVNAVKEVFGDIARVIDGTAMWCVSKREYLSWKKNTSEKTSSTASA